MKKVAVILCGSGFKDGSEIRESVGVLWALSKHGAQADCFAPNAAQSDVVNCLTGNQASQESRNMLVEAARIARGKILPLSKMNPADYSAVIIPGGFGVAKNLCTFATQGSNAQVNADAESVIKAFFEAHKPIGAVCISPALVALSLKGKNLQLTVGPDSEAAQEIAKLGHSHVPTKASECVVDKKNKVVSTPAYMIDDAPLSDIFIGIEKLVKEVLALA